MDEVLNAVVERIVKTVSPDRIILFGSRSKGSAKPDSDYDLLVLKRGTANRRALAHKIYRTLVGIPAPVDVLVDTPESMEKHRHTPGFVHAEAAQGLVIYER